MSDSAHAISTAPPTPEEQAAVQKFLTLIDGDDDLRTYKKFVQESVDRNIVLIALRKLNLDYSAAFKTFKEIYRLITKVYPDLPSKVDPDKVKAIIEKKMIHVLARKTKDDPNLAIFKVGEWKPSQFTPEEMLIAAILFTYGVLQKWPEFQDSKDNVVISDIKGFKLKHARLMTIGRARQALRFYNALPASLRDAKATEDFKGAAITINSKNIFIRAYKMVKRAIPKDLRKYIHITKKDLTIIQKYVPKEKLPVELGGTVPDKDAWATDIESIILGDSKLWKDIKEIRGELLQKTKGIKPEVVVDDDKPLEGEEEDDDKELAGLEEDGEPEEENDSEDEKDTKM